MKVKTSKVKIIAKRKPRKTKIEKFQEELAGMILPLVSQAMYNAMVTLQRELNGNWWEFKTEELEKTYDDICLITRCLEKLGFYALYAKDEKDKSLTHINELSIQNILEDFRYENLLSSSRLHELTKAKIEYGISQGIKELKMLMKLKYENHYKNFYKAYYKGHPEEIFPQPPKIQEQEPKQEEKQIFYQKKKKKQKQKIKEIKTERVIMFRGNPVRIDRL